MSVRIGLLTSLLALPCQAAPGQATPGQATPGQATAGKGAGATESRCVGCHPTESRTQPLTSMAMALTPAMKSDLWANHQQFSLSDGGYQYQLQRQGEGVLYSVRDAQGTARVMLQWAFGVGRVGQTFVFMANGNFYESRVSYYKSLDGLALTTGHAGLATQTLPEAAGRLLSDGEVARCFGCHTTVQGGSLTPGVHCEACHEKAAEHAASLETKKTPAVVPIRLSELTSLAMADRCGVCHRTFQGVRESGPHSPENVRFQPYRLVGSRCFIADDRRISCVACHNPHEELQTKTEAYDAKCQACHQPKSTISNINLCRVAKKDCVTCHMPKVEFPEMHYAFTDHRIRVARVGDKYPE